MSWVFCLILKVVLYYSGAGVLEMRFFTRVNVTDVKVRGTATRGEKIDFQSYKFEGESVRPLLVSLVLKLIKSFPSVAR